MDLYTLLKQYKDVKDCSIKAYEIRLRKLNNDEELFPYSPFYFM